MRDPFYLLLSGETAAPVTWYAPRTAEHRERSGRGGLAEAAAAAAGRHVVAFVPATDVTISQASVPTRNRQRMLMAVPYALEEQLIADVESLHFALGPSAGGGPVPVAVADRARMQAWRDALHGAGLDPQVMTPASLALPFEADAWSLLITPEGSALRSAVHAGLGIDTENIGPLLRGLLADAGEARPQRIRAYLCDGADDATAGIAAQAGVEVERMPGEHACVRLLAENFRADTAINLLQGAFSRTEQFSRLWRPWRAAAALLGIWIVAQLAGNIVGYTQLAGTQQDLQEQMEQLYRNTFPDARNIVDPRAQMQQHLSQLQSGGGGAGFLELMGMTGPALAAVPNLKIANLRGQEGELELDLRLNDLQALDQLKQRLSDTPDLTVEIVSATSREGKVEGRLKIRSKNS